jgi:hypothetical protein
MWMLSSDSGGLVLFVIGRGVESKDVVQSIEPNKSRDAGTNKRKDEVRKK